MRTRLIVGILACLLLGPGLTSMLAQAASANLIPNPSMETSSSGLPTGWSKDSWGTNTATFNYLTAGCQNGTACLSTTISNYVSGDAKWYFTPLTVTPGAHYTFTGWYQSGVATEVDAVWTTSTGQTTYAWLGSAAASSTWKQLSFNLTAPAGAAKLTIYHVIGRNGTLKIDNYSLTSTATPTPLPSATPTPTPTPAPTPTPTPTPSPTPPPANLVPNPGLETPNGSNPASWNADGWGTNTPTFQYLATGHSGSRSVKVTVANYANGAANWSFTPQNVTPGSYQFSDWYQSNVATEIDAAVTMNDGSTQYFYLANVLPSTTWAQAKAQFTVPVGARQITIMHLLATNGFLTTDDYAFAPYVPTGFNRGLVTVTLDDGWSNQYTNARPILTRYGLPATFYIISGELTNQPYYMTGNELRTLATSGHEIASHTVTHTDLTTLTSSQLTTELSQSQTTLQNLLGMPVPNFAYPYGAYNANTITAASRYYQSQRTTDTGFNSKDNFNARGLKVQNIYRTTTVAEVQGWVNQAMRDKTWLILVYHEIADTPLDPSNVDYTTTPADFDASMAAVKNSGIGVVTVRGALAELTPQL